MYSKVSTPEQYIDQLSDDRKEPMRKLRSAILNNLPAGFAETINYGMIGYVVPLSLFPEGYHPTPGQALPFINIASQKGFIALYHMGIYADKSLLDWFKAEYPKYCKAKLDMGKSCIRFKNPEQIPYELISKLITKMSVSDWIAVYKSNLRK